VSWKSLQWLLVEKESEVKRQRQRVQQRKKKQEKDRLLVVSKRYQRFPIFGVVWRQTPKMRAGHSSRLKEGFALRAFARVSAVEVDEKKRKRKEEVVECGAERNSEAGALR